MIESNKLTQNTNFQKSFEGGYEYETDFNILPQSVAPQNTLWLALNKF